MAISEVDLPKLAVHRWQILDLFGGWCPRTQNALYDCQRMVFNPWNCLPGQRPLGSVNPMRLAVYLALRQERLKLDTVGHEQPAEARSFGRTSADASAAESRE
ncbi:hypothetical protein QA641_30725 [Bradyrhizobium sp. CB1650]|uniref:hypothetical protein n=1 Tax=Bradyrhizobium sp. CB1650 TaxID=3039153 RepID=UPI00243547E6|nr:hypothetical protein [Bradyrhizobium sp. CB1650]WGD49985.1 hypothetical protein QA641_30725 [Bradyrhizobium sp. CB1650]